MIKIIIICMLFMGCAGHQIDVITSGEIEQIAHFNGMTYIKLVGDPQSYMCDPAPWHNVGGWVEVVRTEKGCVFQ